MYKLPITLKQHTPIIHFQHNQAGATLRATEVKPKLDQFILEKLGEGNYDIGKQKAKAKGWLIDKDKGALDYKMRISCVGDITKSTLTIIPPESETAIYSDQVNLEVLTKNENLKIKLKDSIDEFFIKTSFGKRSNKGLGCFYPKNLTWNDIAEVLPNDTFFKLNCINRDTEQNYKNVSKINRIIKSGFNHRTYIKSKLFVFLINQQIRWDKRWIKKELNSLIKAGTLSYKLKADKAPNDWYDDLDIRTDNANGTNNNWTDSSEFENNYVFARALLGMSEHWEFMTISDQYKYKVVPEEITNSIERFKSPITFKVFDKHLYVIAENIPSDLLNKGFHFKVQQKRKQGRDWTNDGQPIYFEVNENKKVLNTPTEFNLQDFLNSCLPAQSLNFRNL